MAKNKKIVRYRKPLNINVGMIIFAMIFVYLSFSVYTYLRRDHVQFYEVVEGSIVNNKEYNGILFRDETVENAPQTGYVNYYVREGKRAGAGSRVYSLDETGELGKFLEENQSSGVSLSAENLADLKKQLSSFCLSYNDQRFESVYDAKYSLQASVAEYMNFNALGDMDAQLQAQGINYKQISTPQPGIISYVTDSFEGVAPEEVTADSPTQRVGDATLNDFAEVVHPVPLESLEDVFDGSEVQDFLAKVLETLPRAEYSVEPKVDGLSVALEYRDGVFYQGATRGDGRKGEDVTGNLRTIRSIPMVLPEKLPRLIVRGEVYMARSVFQEINDRLELEGKPLMANPRNAAAGSLRQKDPKVCARRRLDIAVFNLQLAEGRTFTTHAETIEYLKEQGFPAIPHTTLSEGADILREIGRLGDTRMEFPFDIDGAVVKLNNLSDRNILGSTAKCPRWAVAFKYPPERKTSRIRDIVVQVGRTGVLTPKAELEPVRLAGTTVTFATLHNQDYITQKDIRIGDTVVVQKAGEIIPEIVEVVPDRRPSGAAPYYLPQTCPVCGAPVERDPDGAALRCTGAECPAQRLRNLTHFASRNAMDIDGLGPAVLNQLIDKGLVQTAADLYDLTAADIAPLDHMGEKSAANAVAAIYKSRDNDLWRLIFALGIRQVGEKAAKVLARRFGTLQALAQATEEELTAIDDVGPITAAYIRQWMDSPQSQNLMHRLEAAGVNMSCKEELVDSRFTGMTFVLTGSLERFTREEAGQMIEQRGGRSASSVSKKTTYVVAGPGAGSKLRRAQELNIPVLTEDEFLELLE